MTYSTWNAARKTPNENRPELMGVERKDNVVEPEKSPVSESETDRVPPPDSFEQRPSYGGFANLAEEFDARAKSRAKVNELNSGPEKSRAEKIRGAVSKNSEDLVDKAQQAVDKLDSIFGPHPTGQAETSTNSDPQAVDTHHSGVDPGSTVSALLAAGIVGAELFHRVKTKIRREQ